MTFTHALSTNNYGPYKFIVSTSAANGTHTTLASAVSSASSGDVIYLRDSVTENVTIDKSLTICSLTLSARSGGASQPTITGKATITTNSISVKFVGIGLATNSDNILSLNATGTDVIYQDCNLSVASSTGFSVTGATTNLYFKNCYGTAASGAVFYAATTTVVWMEYCRIEGAASTTSTQDGGQVNIVSSSLSIPFTTANAGAIVSEDSQYGGLVAAFSNVTWVTTAGTGTSKFFNCQFYSGTASALSIGSGTTVEMYKGTVSSTNTNAITGAGTILTDSLMSFTNTSRLVNTTTQTYVPVGISGTFTPALDFGGGTTGITYGTRIGNYSKIGRLVYFDLSLVLTAKGSSTGTANITGLPFSTGASAGGSSAIVIFALSANALTYVGQVNARIASAGTSTINLDSWATTGARAVLTDTAFANTTFVQITGVYQANA